MASDLASDEGRLTVVVPGESAGKGYEAAWDDELEEWVDRKEVDATGATIDLAELSEVDLPGIELEAWAAPGHVD